MDILSFFDSRVYQESKQLVKCFVMLLSFLIIVFSSACSDNDDIIKRLDAIEITPSNIVVLNTEPIEILTGAAGKVLFRVNPSNALFCYDVDSSGCEIFIDSIGSKTRSSGYINSPSYYRLCKVEPYNTNISGGANCGQYVAYVEDLRTFNVYEDKICLVISIKNHSGNVVQISSQPFIVKSAELSGLPILSITTPKWKKVNSKNKWIDNSSMEIYQPDGTILYQGTTSIRGRGNTTWLMPKKPYALKLDKKSEILGMKKHKRWCLLSNWFDITFLRNVMAFEISRASGMQWAPSGEFVEFVLNGEHLGNYYLCEQIKIDKNRLNIIEMDSTDVSGDAVTGGYLMEIDLNYDEINKFKPTISQLPYMFKTPDEELNEHQFIYMQNYINEMENALYDSARFARHEYQKYMDIESYAQWWIVHELAGGTEPLEPKSSYCYKDRNGKLKAGPVWDFDWKTFLPHLSNTIVTKDAQYYGQLFKDPTFCEKLKECWLYYKNHSEYIPSFIKTRANLIKKSAQYDRIKWNRSTISWTNLVNLDNYIEYDEAVERLIDAYQTKYQYLETEINKGLFEN